MPRRDEANRSLYWCDREIAGLSLLAADFTTLTFARHAHEALVVAVTEAGGAAFESRGAADAAQPGEVLVFNPTEPHAGRVAAGRWRYRSLYLTEAALDQVAGRLGLERLDYFTRNRLRDQELARGFLALHGALQAAQRRPDARLAAEGLLAEAFGLLLRRHGGAGRRLPPPPRDRRLLERAVALMRERRAEPLRLEELAAALGLTAFQLNGLFKRTAGLTPHSFLVRLRLNAACSALKRGVAPAEAAALAGFYDQSALNRHFKRAFALTPLQYARAQSA